MRAACIMYVCMYVHMYVLCFMYSVCSIYYVLCMYVHNIYVKCNVCMCIIMQSHLLSRASLVMMLSILPTTPSRPRRLYVTKKEGVSLASLSGELSSIPKIDMFHLPPAPAHFQKYVYYYVSKVKSI